MSVVIVGNITTDARSVVLNDGDCLEEEVADSGVSKCSSAEPTSTAFTDQSLFSSADATCKSAPNQQSLVLSLPY